MSVPSFELKLHRAHEHFDEVKQAIEWWIESEPYEVADKINAETGLHEILITRIERVPARLGLMVGDTVGNMRAALDHLVGELARENAGGHLMPRVEEDLAFPICTSLRSFRGQRRTGRMGCVAPRAQVAIHRLQPYRQQTWNPDPLWVLHQLSNIDKHRRIALVSFEMRPSGTLIRRMTGSFAHLETVDIAKFEVGTVLMRYLGEMEELDIHPVYTPLITFGESVAAGAEVIPVLSGLLRYIFEEVLPPLTPFL